MNIFSVSGLINTITVLVLGALVYFKDTKKEINVRYAQFCLFVAIWSLCYCFWQAAVKHDTALFWVRALMSGAIFIPISFLHFVVLLLGIYPRKRKIVRIGYLFFLVFFLSNLGPWFIKDVVPKMFFPFWPAPGPVFALFLVVWISYCFYACYLLITHYKGFSGINREQIKYVLIGILIGYVSGSTNYFLWYDIPIPPYGNFIVPGFVGMMAYAIVRYRLMDISIVLTRTGIFIAVYTLILGLPFAVAVWLKAWLIDTFGAGWWMMPLGLMAILATIGPFVYIGLERKAEEKLLKEQRRYQQTLKQASIGMTRIRNLHKLLDLITHIVTKTVKISFAAVYLYDQHDNEYKLQVSRDKGHSLIPKIVGDDPLIAWLLGKHDPVIFEEMKRQVQDSGDETSRKVVESMHQMNASVVIPSFLEYRLIGFIVLGDKLSRQMYTIEDLNVFQVLATQAALAIENAQFYEEAKVMQEQIAQAEKMATIGTMADGLSHQINNRFYALSLIASDTIDTIKVTDTSQCTPEVRQMIAEINKALERIQANVTQGGEVVKGILKYTRKGEEGFEKLTLDQILNGTLDMIQFKIRLSEVDIIRNYPKDAPMIYGNLVQLQEVFFNFIDNAYDAIMERRAMLKEEGYRGRISVSIKNANEKYVGIYIEDNGMGVKDQNNKKLFTPFFTTKTSSRKGTGLGLYVIRRIITDIHRGTISFESAYQSGTRFTVELPIAHT